MTAFLSIIPGIKWAYGVLMTVLLLTSFSLHAIQVPHEHASGVDHHHSSENTAGSYWSLGDYMHASDQKFLMVLPAPLFASLAVLAMLYGSWTQFLTLIKRLVAVVFLFKRFQLSIRRCYLSFYYSRGLYNPKPY